MELVAKTIDTPVGVYPAPLNPAFFKELKKCKTNEDLFKLVEPNGFINPDALNEVKARELLGEYQDWRKEVIFNNGVTKNVKPKQKAPVFLVMALSSIVCEHGEERHQLLETTTELDFSPNIDKEDYCGPDGKPNPEGLIMMTNAFIYGLSNNVHYGAGKGFQTKEEHLEYIITELTRSVNSV